MRAGLYTVRMQARLRMLTSMIASSVLGRSDASRSGIFLLLFNACDTRDRGRARAWKSGVKIQLEQVCIK